MKNKAYPKYKPSDVKWLGDVPEHWEVKRARFMLSMNPSKQEIKHLDPETELAFLPMEAVGENGTLRLETTRPISEVSNGYTFFVEDDVAFAKITPCFENGKGAIMRNLGTGFGFGTTELTVIRPSDNIDVMYLYFLTVSNDFRKNGEAWMYGAGGQKRVPDDFVSEFRIGFPPLPEQQAIAAFLDRETGRIDTLIAKKQQLLELLAEQRTALISRAVTKGLDDNVKLKPSGVEWLGDVPEHWEVLPLKFICDVRDGTHDTPEYVNPNEDSFPLVTSKDLSTGVLSFEQTNNISVSDYLLISKRSGVRKGDILMPMIGTVGGAVLVNIETKFAIKNIALFKNSKAFSNRWLTYHLNSDIVFNQFDLKKTGGVQGFVALGTLRNLSIICPPLPEQQAIATYLDRETSKIDALSAKVTTVIERLREYRTALISSAVTGRIDVSTEFILSNVEGLNTSVREAV